MPEKRIGKARLIDQITDNAMIEGSCHGTDKINRTHYDMWPDYQKVGYRIKQLSEDEREVLKTATDKDFDTRLFK